MSVLGTHSLNEGVVVKRIADLRSGWLGEIARQSAVDVVVCNDNRTGCVDAVAVERSASGDRAHLVHAVPDKFARSAVYRQMTNERRLEARGGVDDHHDASD